MTGLGRGELDFPPILRALHDTGHRGLVAAALTAPDLVARSLEFLRRAERAARWLP